MLEKIFESSSFLENSNDLILQTSLPKQIIKELDQIVSIAKKEMRHPLSHLKEHFNAGNNKYQVSVNRNVLNDSFLYPFIIKFGMYYLKQKNVFCNDQEIVITGYSIGNFNYGFWVNISGNGDLNPKHNHTGLLSGVIYFKNNINLPTKFYCGDDIVEYCGKQGDILIFPSHLPHEVEKITCDEERITLSFNLERVPMHFLQNTIEHIYKK